MRYSFKAKDRSLPLYVDSIGYDWTQELINRPKGYPYIHWLQTYEGSGTIQIEDREIELKPHQGILINRGIPNSYFANNENWQTGYFTFGGSLVAEITAALGFRDYLYLDRYEPKIFNFIKTHYDEIESHDQFNLYGSSELVYQFLLLLKKYMVSNPRNQEIYQKIIEPVLKLINHSYTNDLQNTDFQAVTHYSTQYILEAFRMYYGSSPHQVLVDLRIRKAKELLLNQPELSVEEVGRRVGFNTYSYFILMFKRSEKVTPGRFRRFYF